MSLMKWDGSFGVKVGQIDEQHKRLIAMVNELNDAMIEQRGKDILGQLLGDLADYTLNHFGLEEKYFDEFGYPEAEAHIDEHNKLIDKVIGFRREFESGNDSISTELMEFLKEWLTDHIKGTDQKYSQCFIDNGLN